ETALAELVGCVLRQDAKRLIARKISVQTEDLTHTVRTDAKWLRFILRQMIDNSIKYGATRLEFVSRESAGGIVLLLRDNGVGIPTQELARVFEKGFTGENGRRFGRSTGLGLYLCRLLCQKMGLELAASSVPGEGATMEIRFPLNDFYV
ncbi:MAG: sensor histidine kinase, partial [Oscillospiraceae bacterium]|nr:sensor histidine kinase [Oscillospiraceae bacterium]